MTDQTPRRLPVVGVMGSGTRGWEELSVPLGRWLASCGMHLLTGGGGGVMAAVSRAFVEVSPRRGLCLGILPGAPEREGCPTPEGYPNRWVELAIRTHLPARGGEGERRASRNHLNVLSSDVLIALPGGPGTRSEVELARRYGRPLVALLGPDGTIAGERETLAVPLAEGLGELRGMLARFGVGETAGSE